VAARSSHNRDTQGEKAPAIQPQRLVGHLECRLPGFAFAGASAFAAGADIKAFTKMDEAGGKELIEDGHALLREFGTEGIATIAARWVLDKPQVALALVGAPWATAALTAAFSSLAPSARPWRSRSSGTAR